MSFSDLLIHFPEIDDTQISCIDSVRAFQIAKIAERNCALVIAPNSRVADLLISELQSITKTQICEFLPWETLPHERLSPKSDTVTKRIKVLKDISDSSSQKIIVTSIRGLLQPISRSILETAPLTLAPKLESDMQDILERLIHFGFTRTDLVERRGDFAVRGGIVDVFPSDYEHPIRIDFFGEIGRAHV